MTAQGRALGCFVIWMPREKRANPPNNTYLMGRKLTFALAGLQMGMACNLGRCPSYQILPSEANSMVVPPEGETYQFEFASV